MVCANHRFKRSNSMDIHSWRMILQTKLPRGNPRASRLNVDLILASPLEKLPIRQPGLGVIGTDYSIRLGSIISLSAIQIYLKRLHVLSLKSKRIFILLLEHFFNT
jgi:hypothetical protein